MGLLKSYEAIRRPLIEKGADIDDSDNDGWFPLHSGIQSNWTSINNGRLNLARLLIERGVNIPPNDKDGKIPLHSASKNRARVITNPRKERQSWNLVFDIVNDGIKKIIRDH